MRPIRLYGPLSLVLFTLFSPALTFNVDMVTNTLHHGPYEMFGFAIAQYRLEGTSWLIIGAPKALTNQSTGRYDGAVYRCDPHRSNICHQIMYDEKVLAEEMERSFVITDAKDITREFAEDRPARWLGATVETSGENGVIVACAPRHTYFNNSKVEPVGVCWISKGGFSGAKPYIPCSDFHMLKYSKKGHCHAGFSAAATKSGERLYMGAVGSWHSQGQVFSQNLLQDDDLYETIRAPSMYDDHYLGYSTAVGEFNGDDDMDVVVGMPRDNLIGKVVLFDSRMNNLLNISGEQMASYFGYSVCVADLNGDKLDDIIIGAPLYSDFGAKRGKYDEGRVYVIYQTRMHDFDGMVHLDGKHSRGRFGLALTSVGDINRDSYEDFAVGAPYGGEHGKGAVYIFHGSSKGVKKEPSQVIEPHNFGHNDISTFGFSLSGGMDLDNNHYPDLSVGAYESKSAIHFRSRPIANVTARLEVSLESISLEETKCKLKDGTAVSCFTVYFCLGYTGIGVAHELGFHYVLQLDPKKDESRIFFLSDVSKRENSIRLRKDSHFCTDEDFVYLQPNIRDKLTPIGVSLKYFLMDPHPTSRTLKPIINQGVPDEVVKQITILKNCGKDNECYPDLQLDVIPSMDKFIVEERNRLELNVIISNAGEDAFEAMFYLLMPLDVNLIGINETRTDFSIPCSGAQPETGVNILFCDIGNPLSTNASLQFRVVLEPSGIVHAIDEFIFTAIVNSSNPEFDNRTFDNHAEIHLPIIVEAEVLIHRESNPEIVSYNKSDPVPARKLKASDIGPEVIHVYKVINNGPSTIKKAIVFIVWPSYNLEGEPLLYLMEQPIIKGRNAVCNEVLRDVNRLGVQKEARKSKKKPSVNITDMKGKSPQDVDEAHPLSEIFQRRRRDIDLPLALIEKLQCGETTCTRIECSLNNMKKDDTVVFELRSRLWRESVNKLNLEEVTISSRMVIGIRELIYSVDVSSLPIKDAKATTTVQLLDVALKPSEVPWWIIMLAVCGGLLLLGLLALLLWKLGFFERKRPQEEEPEKVPLQKNGYQMTRGDEAL